MRLKLPSQEETDGHFYKARFPKKACSNGDQLEISGKEIAELSVKATLFNEGTLKNLLKEKSSFSQLDDDDFVIPKRLAIFKSKRLQNKMKKTDVEKKKVRTEKISKINKEQNDESLVTDNDKESGNKEGEKKSEIEGQCKHYVIVHNYLLEVYNVKYSLNHNLQTCITGLQPD